MATENVPVVQKKMREGAFAVLDCLGFKGAWTRQADANEIIKFLKESQGHVQNSIPFRNFDMGRLGGVEASIAFISDTVVIGAQPTSISAPMPGEARGYLVTAVAILCAELINRFLNGPLPFALRGCIAYGDFIVDGSFYLGGAVDQAASFSQIADGAFVWITPECDEYTFLFRTSVDNYSNGAIAKNDTKVLLDFARTYRTNVQKVNPNASIPEEFMRFDLLSSTRQLQYARAIFRIATSALRSDFLIRYPMPTKANGVLNAEIVNPYYWHAVVDSDPLLAPYLLSFRGSHDIGVLKKRQHTLDFLGAAQARSQDAIGATIKKVREIEKEELGAPVLTDAQAYQFVNTRVSV